MEKREGDQKDLWVCVQVCTSFWVSMYVCVSVYMCVCVHECVFICVYVCVLCVHVNFKEVAQERLAQNWTLSTGLREETE